MRHHAAYQLPEGGWHYASVGRRGGHPLGNCRNHEPHPTEDEARECYAEYRRDHVRLDGGPTSWSNCSVGRGTESKCDEPANRYAYIQGDGFSMAPLCHTHLTIEDALVVLRLIGPAGDAWTTG